MSKPLVKITWPDAERWLKDLDERKVLNRVKIIYLRAVKKWLKWFIEHSGNSAKTVQQVYSQLNGLKLLPEEEEEREDAGLTLEEVDKLVEATDKEIKKNPGNIKALRDRALFCCFSCAALVTDLSSTFFSGIGGLAALLFCRDDNAFSIARESLSAWEGGGCVSGTSAIPDAVCE